MRSAIVIFVSISCMALSALANPPEISLGVRVMMLPGSTYNEKRKTDPRIWSFFVPRQLEILGADATNTSEGQPLSSPGDVLKFFANLPSSTQKNGLWITLMGKGPSVQFDFDRLSALTDGATQRGLLMFICKPREATTRGSWLVAWECNKVSPQKSTQPVICEPRKSPNPSGAPLWDCAETRLQEVPKTSLQGAPVSRRP
jgi:hypothetical protein